VSDQSGKSLRRGS
jgi:hypothetical protein